MTLTEDIANKWASAESTSDGRNAQSEGQEDGWLMSLRRWQVTVSVHGACERQDWKVVGTGSGDLSNRIRKQQVSFETVQVENQVQKN